MKAKDQAVQKAIDTLVRLCDAEPIDKDAEDRYEIQEHRRSRLNAAEEILRHYREDALVDRLAHIEITINGALPVRPMTRAEVTA